MFTHGQDIIQGAGEGEDARYFLICYSFPVQVNISFLFQPSEEYGDIASIDVVSEQAEIVNGTILNIPAIISDGPSPCELVTIIAEFEDGLHEDQRFMWICSYESAWSTDLSSLRLGETKAINITSMYNTMDVFSVIQGSQLTLYYENCSAPILPGAVLSPVASVEDDVGNEEGVEYIYSICVCACSYTPSRYNIHEEFAYGNGLNGDIAIRRINITQPILANFQNLTDTSVLTGSEIFLLSTKDNISDTFDVRKYGISTPVSPTKGEIVEQIDGEGSPVIYYKAQQAGTDTFSIEVYPIEHPELHTNASIGYGMFSITSTALVTSAPTPATVLKPTEQIEGHMETAISLRAKLSGNPTRLVRLKITQEPIIGYFFTPDWDPKLYLQRDELVMEGEEDNANLLEFPTHTLIQARGTVQLIGELLGNMSYISVASGRVTVTYILQSFQEGDNTSQALSEKITNLKITDPAIGNRDDAFVLSSVEGILAIVAGTIGALIPILILIWFAVKQLRKNAGKASSSLV